MNDLRHIHDEGLSPAAHAALAALRAEEDEMPAARASACGPAWRMRRRRPRRAGTGAGAGR